MFEYFDKGKIVASRYTPPAGWGVPKIDYATIYNGYPGWTWTVLSVYKGKKKLLIIRRQDYYIYRLLTKIQISVFVFIHLQ